MESPSVVRFRKIDSSELPTIRRLAHETWPVAYGELLSKDQINYMLELIYSIESLEKQIFERDHQFMVAENDMQVCGFASYEVNYKAEPQLMVH